MPRYSTPRPGGGLINTHTRITPGPMVEAATLLEGIAEPGSPLWPEGRWSPMVMDRGLEIGSRGTNGAIRYHVVSHTPGRAVTFRFDPGMPMQGTHGLTIDPEPGSEGHVRWTHVADLESLTRFARHVIVPLHDAVMEDLLDAAEAHLSGRPPLRRSLPPWLEALHVLAQRATSVTRRGRG